MRIFLMLLFVGNVAQALQTVQGSNACNEMEVWDFTAGMCMPLPMKGMPMRMLMFQGNAFATQSWLSHPRGHSAFAIPNWFMADIGTSLGDHHYINLDFMGTVERWTFPDNGYPEFLQIGESKSNGEAFLDSQHPHSSPVMGLTLSDTIAIGGKDYAKFWFAPRGQSSDGPIAFMHRATGNVNPDAPLGHHVGQDAGHISSTVFGGMLHLNSSSLEISGFHGREPEPTKVDLPMGRIDSYSVRLSQELTPHLFAMASAAYVKSPESQDPDLDHVLRYSASLYAHNEPSGGWTVANAFIWGLANHYDHASSLTSFAEELLLRHEDNSFWGRIEVLQRTPEELEIVAHDLDRGRWVGAVTLGYTRRVVNWGESELGLGGSVTQDILPPEYREAYGGAPIAGRVFLQLSSQKMWNL